MKFGYARVSTKDQNLDLQIDALNNAGCQQIFTDKSSGKNIDRPGFDDLRSHLRSGDILVICKLDRLARSLKHLVELVTEFNQSEIGLISIDDPIDTTTAQGRLVFNIFASLAEFEREIIRERTMAGLAAARARGRIGGRKKGLSEEAKNTARLAESLYKDDIPVKDICKSLNIAKGTLYNYLRHRGVAIGEYKKQNSQ